MTKTNEETKVLNIKRKDTWSGTVEEIKSEWTTIESFISDVRRMYSYNFEATKISENEIALGERYIFTFS